MENYSGNNGTMGIIEDFEERVNSPLTYVITYNDGTRVKVIAIPSERFLDKPIRGYSLTSCANTGCSPKSMHRAGEGNMPVLENGKYVCAVKGRNVPCDFGVYLAIRDKANQKK